MKKGCSVAFVAVALFAVLLSSAACGDSGDGIGESEAADVTNNYLRTTLGLFTGTTDAQAFIDQYAPECREGVEPAGLAFIAAFMQGLAPELRGVQIEAIDAGPLDITKTDDGVRVSPKDPGALRVKVAGEFVSAEAFFSEAGFVPTDGTTPEAILLVRRGDQVFLGDCDELRDLAGGLGS